LFLFALDYASLLISSLVMDC